MINTSSIVINKVKVYKNFLIWMPYSESDHIRTHLEGNLGSIGPPAKHSPAVWELAFGPTSS